jgi:hypothetical protein
VKEDYIEMSIWLEGVDYRRDSVSIHEVVFYFFIFFIFFIFLFIYLFYLIFYSYLSIYLFTILERGLGLDSILVSGLIM